MTRSSLYTFKLATLAAAIAMTALPAAAQQFTLIVPSPGVAADLLRNLGVSLADVNLPSGLPGQPYSGDLRGALQITDDIPGEPEVAQWDIVSGALPEGLTFIDGVINGPQPVLKMPTSWCRSPTAARGLSAPTT